MEEWENGVQGYKRYITSTNTKNRELTDKIRDFYKLQVATKRQITNNNKKTFPSKSSDLEGNIEYQSIALHFNWNKLHYITLFTKISDLILPKDCIIIIIIIIIE